MHALIMFIRNAISRRKSKMMLLFRRNKVESRKAHCLLWSLSSHCSITRRDAADKHGNKSTTYELGESGAEEAKAFRASCKQESGSGRVSFVFRPFHIIKKYPQNIAADFRLPLILCRVM